MRWQGKDYGMPTFYQDNKSAIAIMQPKAKKVKKKSVLTRQCEMQELQAENEFEIKYCETESMVADILTKQMPGSIFRMLRDVLLGRKTWMEVRENIGGYKREQRKNQSLSDLQKFEVVDSTFMLRDSVNQWSEY